MPGIPLHKVSKPVKNCENEVDVMNGMQREDLGSTDKVQQGFFENEFEIERKKFCSAHKIQTNTSTDTSGKKIY